MPEVGRYKLAYIKKGMPDMLYSKMFNDLGDAVAFSKSISGPWLLMEQVVASGTEYAWDLLPYGKYKEYRTGLKISEMKYAILVGVLIVLFVAYKLWK
jgi:hypothetical protein